MTARQERRDLAEKYHQTDKPIAPHVAMKARAREDMKEHELREVRKAIIFARILYAYPYL